MDAIRNSYYGRAHKLFMQFSERWWETTYGITHGLTVTDLAIRNVVYPPAGQDSRSGRGVMIASYCWEQDSLPYTPLAQEECIAQALEDLSKIHPEARDTFEFGVYKDWALDWFACGIGPLFRPFEMSEGFYSASPPLRDFQAWLRSREWCGCRVDCGWPPSRCP